MKNVLTNIDFLKEKVISYVQFVEGREFLFMQFTDGSCCFVGADVEIDREHTLYLESGSGIQDNTLFDLNVITKSELDARMAVKTEARRNRQRFEYEILKKQFEGK